MIDIMHGAPVVVQSAARGRPTRAVLLEQLTYNRHTGVFTWNLRRDVGPAWNARYANVVAGRTATNGYINIKTNGREFGAHRLAWLYVHGEWPAHSIDHINRIRDDNRISNLREATPTENRRNCLRRKRSGTPPGIRLRGSGWSAEIEIQGKSLWLGSFQTEGEAYAAYQAAVKAYHGAFACLETAPA